MAKFRKKPVVIEAVRYRAGEQDGCFAQDVIDGRIRYPEDGTMLIKTLEGEMIARPGDWIIRGVKGELYPCKPDIFAATYEPVEPVMPTDLTPAGDAMTREQEVVKRLRDAADFYRRILIDRDSHTETAMRDAIATIERLASERDAARLHLKNEGIINDGLCARMLAAEAALATAHAQGEAQGIERAAKWHDDKVAEYLRFAKIAKTHGNEANRDMFMVHAERHNTFVAAIRALEPSSAAPVPAEKQGWDREASRARIKASAEALLPSPASLDSDGGDGVTSKGRAE